MLVWMIVCVGLVIGNLSIVYPARRPIAAGLLYSPAACDPKLNKQEKKWMDRYWYMGIQTFFDIASTPKQKS